MEPEAKKKVIVISGCTGRRGALGAYFAKQLLAQGHTVVGIARHTPKQMVDGLDFLEADITTDIKQITEYLSTHYGMTHILINNAIAHVTRPLIEKDPNEFEQELRVGLVSPLACTNEFINTFWKQRSREENMRENINIVNISSISGLQIYRNCNQGTYATIKSGLNMLTWHMAEEYSDLYGLRTNAIAPNSIPNPASYEQVFELLEQLIYGNQNGDILTTEPVNTKI